MGLFYPYYIFVELWAPAKITGIWAHLVDQSAQSESIQNNSLCTEFLEQFKVWEPFLPDFTAKIKGKCWYPWDGGP